MVIAPVDPLTVNRSPSPTVRAAVGDVSPIPTLPVLSMTILVLASVVPPVRNYKDPDSVACKITSPAPEDWITVVKADETVKVDEA